MAVNLDNGGVKRAIVVPAPTAAWQAIHRNRASLLLADGVVYAAYSSLCEGDEERFHGTIFAFDAKTLDTVGYFQVTDDATDGGGIWQGSTGIAADNRGNLYFSTGNRRTWVEGELATIDHPTLSNSVIRLKTEKIGRNNQIPRPAEPYRVTMKVADYFTPYRRIWQDHIDLDLGSAGVLLIPRTRYLAAGGKEGMIYVLDRANMGRWDDIDDAWHYEKMLSKRSKLPMQEPDDPYRDNVHQKFPAAVNQYQNDRNQTFHDANQVNMVDWMTWPHIHGTPVFARFNDQGYMFVWPEKDKPKRYCWRDEAFDPRPNCSRDNAFDPKTQPKPLEGDVLAPPVPLPESKFPDDSPNSFGNGMPGGFLSVNIDESRPNFGVVFGSVPECRTEDRNGKPFECADQRYGALRAFDPFTMKEIWNNRGMNGHALDDYWFAKYVPPTIAAGRVFLATASGKVIVYAP